MNKINCSKNIDVASIKYLKRCSEVELFLNINKNHNILENYNNRKYYEKLSNDYKNIQDDSMAKYFEAKSLSSTHIITSFEKLESIKRELYYAMLQTSRFNVNLKVDDNGNLIMTDEFLTWYYGWDNYINNMDEDTLMLFRKCRYEGVGLEYFSVQKNITSKEIEDKLEEGIIKKYPPIGVTANKNIRQKLA